MPGGDRTGPMGMGPMTGRAAGYCAGYGVPGYTSPAYGRGFGFGFGRGRGGWGRGFGRGFGWRGFPAWGDFGGYAPPYYGYAAPYGNPNPDMEKEALKNQADALQSELEFIKKRLEEVEAGTAQE
ncbi:MAG TPA: hypothetical protein ENN35_07075 [Deltaproteobacteria bacterium]|nr:hypothetical protein [Deltaproteobacteria bacterium]